MPVSIGAGPLPQSLQTLERQTGIELLFDSSSIIGLQSPAVRGNLSTEGALRQLLAKTDLTVRRAESGAWIVERPAAPPLARPDAVVPEILVVGQRTQNADIRRFENDVQPYTVVTKAEILGAHRDDVDQYFTSRITANTQVVPTGLSQSADTGSAIDLRGLGSENTLVLIDGRRMPRLPISGTGFRQVDLNAIPLHAIKRIEVLTGTAGGIYGFGALGGVVNVVLDRDSRGLELHVTGGISSRGDAGRRAVEASFGHTSEDGRTDFTLFASHSQSDPLLVGQRGYAVRDRQLNAELLGQMALLEQPHGNSVSVLGLGSNLVFKPEFGGAALPSDHTFLPTGFSGSAAALATTLTQHAGQMDFTLAEGDAHSDLGSNPRSDALLVNVRHRFSEGLEAYADAVVLRSRGESNNRRSDGSAIMSPTSPANPFTSYIAVYFPVSRMDQQVAKRVESTRYTAGIMTKLPLDWRGTAEASLGSFRYTVSTFGQTPSQDFLFLFGNPSDLDVNPLGDWNAFQHAMTADPNRFSSGYTFHDHFSDDSLRLAGPVFSIGAGPTTLTLLAEHWKEDVPTSSQIDSSEFGGMTDTTLTPIFSRSSATTSLYAELRSRVFAASAPAPPLQGLELQLAVRRDDERDDFARNPSGNDDAGRVHARFVGTVYTAGAKITPWPWLMLRGSYATGEQPPPLYALRERDQQITTGASIADPKRGGTYLGMDGPVLYKGEGDESLEAVRTSTAFWGTVLTPFGEDGPRLAIDFSRIRETRDLLSLTPDLVMAHEDFWPQRVIRAPLTDADRAKGYTAGRVIVIDTRDMNGAARNVDAIDAHAEWPLRFLNGRLRLYADATYQMNNREMGFFQPDMQSAGYFNGPLKWRANGGVDWSTDRLTIGTNLQYFGSSLVIQQGQLPILNDLTVEAQGSRYIPSQVYLDLHTTWRFPIRDPAQSPELALDFGIINVLDRAPPRESSFIDMGPGYSRYGDPRQRRFELVLSGRF
jgi:outer membrane receptor protein involved in Fe transport